VIVARREIRFATLHDAVADAEQLLASGYVRAGTWSPGQCCGHLSNWLNYQIDGFPKLPLLLKPVFWTVKNTMATSILNKVIAKGTMPAGSSTAPESVPAADVNDAAMVQAYKLAVDRWLAHTGELYPSPLFGRQPREKWETLHRVHAAHHLSFLIPNG
jgi:hypothetical protein